MFDFDNFREIFGTIKKNKLRTFLTGFSVSWGIFMLIVLLGAGNGLRNGVMYNFRNMAMNKVEVWPRFTTLPYKGMQTNRPITFKEEDYVAISREHSEIDLKSATINHNDTLFYGREYNNCQLNGIFPAYSGINFVEMQAGKGRFINDLDIQQKRKVVVISPRMEEVLFRKESALGKYVRAGSVMYQVVGVYKDDNKSNDAPCYIPFSTGQSLYSSGYGLNQLSFTITGVNTEDENTSFEDRFRQRMGRRHQFDPADKSAIGMWNTANEFRMFNSMMNGILAFVWIVGIGTLIAGIVGVSNIMLISVRERTKEFGIRKAVGATPLSILKLVIFESIIITAIFGYIGMILGIGLTELINYGMQASGMGEAAGQDDISMFRDPTVSLTISLVSTGILILAGVLAGYFPAQKAVKITAIEAMRAE
ncbi:MAG: ABC transporter permease [Parabacteroides sp.]|jgi:putative ABC transport system permease protein|nr:ABC transporter permease [Parabacteroides sp.]